MTVAGQPQVTYTYDNANRLTQIAQGTSTVGFSYDTINRRSTLTLSNGVNMAYTYDNDSRVTGISYKFNANTLGDLSYSYDSLGRRTQVGGSFAQTGLPGAIASAMYDAANELTNWNGTAISYDLNGNMLSDGANLFTWNARNQVATLNSVSLQYDGFGRRIQNAAGKSFLYDGANTAQELSGSTVTTNLLSGGIDEMFTRADSSGAYSPLKDALGSTIALVDASGGLVTQYSYDPFGNTTVSGAANTNGFQYTGRENEGNGLYFYRARYYSPMLGRFVSEDPLRFSGGMNFFTYALSSPTNFVDPSGQTIVVSGTPQDNQNYLDSINYLKQDPGMEAIIQRLEDSKTVFTIAFNNDLDNSFDYTTQTINWDTTAACETSSGGIQSAALGLGHELAHADHGWWGYYLSRARFSVTLGGRYDNLEEWRVISGAEADAARTLGEPTNTDHHCIRRFEPVSPLFHTHVPKIDSFPTGPDGEPRLVP